MSPHSQPRLRIKDEREKHLLSTQIRLLDMSRVIIFSEISMSISTVRREQCRVLVLSSVLEVLLTPILKV